MRWLFAVAIIYAIGIGVPWRLPDDDDAAPAPLLLRRADLKILRETVQEFANNEGCYPSRLSDLVVSDPPECGQIYGEPVRIDPKKWKGPYLNRICSDCISGKPYVLDLVHEQILAPGEKPHSDGSTHCEW